MLNQPIACQNWGFDSSRHIESIVNTGFRWPRRPSASSAITNGTPMMRINLIIASSVSLSTLTARRASQVMVAPLPRGGTQSVGVDKLTRRALLWCPAAAFQCSTRERPLASHCALLRNTTGQGSRRCDYTRRADEQPGQSVRRHLANQNRQKQHLSSYPAHPESWIDNLYRDLSYAHSPC